MFQESEFSDDFSLLKKSRYEEHFEKDVAHVRPQGRFAAELVSIYYVAASKVRYFDDNAKDVDFFTSDLDELLPSLSEQVGAMVHRFQIIPESAVPVSFARLAGPLEPPKRPFIAAILAVLVQALILEYCGIIIPPSMFDFWFNVVVGTRASPISYLWLDAKIHIAQCFTQNVKVDVFGQGIIGEKFKGLQKLPFFSEGAEYMVHTSTGFRRYHPKSDKICSFTTLAGDFNENCYCWKIWKDAFVSLTSTIQRSIEEKVKDAKLIFAHSVERVCSLALQVNKILENHGGAQELRDSSPDIVLLFSGTTGDYVAISLFSALKFSLSEYFSGFSTTKLGVEHSSDIMSSLFYRFVKYYTFLTPCKRHLSLLDECQKIWRQTSQKDYQISGFSSVITRGVQGDENHVPLVLQETVVHDSCTQTLILNAGTTLSLEKGNFCLPLFSKSIYSGLYGFEKRTKLVDCIRLQAKLAAINTSNDDHILQESCKVYGNERLLCCSELSKCNLTVSFDNEWCTLELPALEEETELTFQSFLRSEIDSLAKQTVYKASESLHDQGRLA